jgi:hypothetical protein
MSLGVREPAEFARQEEQQSGRHEQARFAARERPGSGRKMTDSQQGKKDHDGARPETHPHRVLREWRSCQSARISSR